MRKKKKKKKRSRARETWQFLLFPNMELCYTDNKSALYRQSRQHVLSGCWPVSGSGRPVRFWDGKRNVKRKTFGVSVECLEIHRVVWPALLVSQSILVCIVASIAIASLSIQHVLPLLARRRAHHEITTAPSWRAPIFIKRQHNTRFEKEIVNVFVICFFVCARPLEMICAHHHCSHGQVI